MTISISYRLITLYGFTEGIINENGNENAPLVPTNLLYAN